MINCILYWKGLWSRLTGCAIATKPEGGSQQTRQLAGWDNTSTSNEQRHCYQVTVETTPKLVEQARKTARLVRAALNLEPCPGALKVVIGPNTNGQWQEFTTKHTLEKACLEEASHQFSQANDTPLLQNPFLKIFREIGTNKLAFKQVLVEKFQSEHSNNTYTTKLLQQLQCPSQVHNLPQQTTQEYASGWWKARESMASLPSGIHFSHYMASTFNLNILLFNATMADLPMKMGYLLNQWREGVNMMLEKTPGNFNVEKL